MKRVGFAIVALAHLMVLTGCQHGKLTQCQNDNDTLREKVAQLEETKKLDDDAAMELITKLMNEATELAGQVDSLKKELNEVRAQADKNKEKAKNTLAALLQCQEDAAKLEQENAQLKAKPQGSPAAADN